MIETKLSLSPEQIAKKVEAYIITLGERGSEIYFNNDKAQIDAVLCEVPG